MAKILVTGAAGFIGSQGMAGEIKIY